MELYNSEFKNEKNLRKDKIIANMLNAGADAVLIADNSNIFYTSGRVFNGLVYIDKYGNELFFIRRPIGFEGNDIHYIRKPEDIPSILAKLDIEFPSSIGLELDIIPYSQIERYKLLFPNAEIINGSHIMQATRAVKTPHEIDIMRATCKKHVEVYSDICKIYREGMTDVELQIEIERISRLMGSLGQFRISGQSMEIFAGSVVCGSNADTPGPYDFTIGGAGLNPSLPVGCNGSVINPGESVMVDIGGNFYGYMSDMTRSFYTLRKLPEKAIHAHNTSIAICHEIEKQCVPGTKASDMYDLAATMAREASLEEYFMGYTQKAGFIGHGVGIEINELPVFSPKSRNVVEEGNIIAIEPKFVFPDTGAVGIENTYLVTHTGLECLTKFKEELIELIP